MAATARALISDMASQGGSGGGEGPPFSAVQRLVARYPQLLPADDTPRAFIIWMAQHGHSGDWMQSDLYETYVTTCEAAGWKAMSEMAFSAGLNHVGLLKGQMDLRRNGKRYRPTYYVIPEAGDLPK